MGLFCFVSCLVGFYFYPPLSSLFDLRYINFIQVAPGLQCLLFFTDLCTHFVPQSFKVEYSLDLFPV